MLQVGLILALASGLLEEGQRPKLPSTFHVESLSTSSLDEKFAFLKIEGKLAITNSLTRPVRIGTCVAVGYSVWNGKHLVTKATLTMAHSGDIQLRAIRRKGVRVQPVVVTLPITKTVLREDLRLGVTFECYGDFQADVEITSDQLKRIRPK